MLNSKKFRGFEVILAILYGLLFFSFPVLSWYIHDYETGSNFANTFTPILSFTGSVLVYLALKSQIKANTIIQQQLEYDKFINQVESLNVRILNSEIKFDDGIISGYKIFDTILLDIVNNQKDYAKASCKQIITKQIAHISDSDLEYFVRFFRNDGSYEFDVDDKVIQLKEAAKKDNFSEYLDANFDFTEGEPDQNLVTKKDVFDIIACGHFYLMSESFKQGIYYFSYAQTYTKYNDFMESYSKRIFSILNSIFKMENSREDSILYLRNILTTKEKIFLYQNLLAKTSISIHETEILLKIIGFSGDELLYNSQFFIALTNNTSLEMELDSIKNILTTK